MTDKPKIALIDYGLGNLFSVARAIEAAGAVPHMVSKGDEFNGADGMVVPGVGAFGDGIRNLKDRGLDALILDQFLAGTPIMGICLGMQIMFETSEEFGEHRGLGLIKGRVTRFPHGAVHKGRPLKVPHIGWHRVSLSSNNPYCIALSASTQTAIDRGYFYFVHSYYAAQVPDQNILTTTSFGELKYCSSVVEKSFIGFQFHPEKSGPLGLNVYKDWIQNLGRKI
jgi:glutamine amidotransferase